MRPFTIMLFACFLAPAAAAAAAAAAPTRPIQEYDYRRLISLGSPAISPDGKRAAVVVTRVSWDEDKRKPELVLVDLATHASRVLTYDRNGVADPAFSPDGSKLAFIADNGTGEDAASQVFVMRFDGGDPRPITHAKAGVDQFAWRPDGGAIAYAASDPKPVRKGTDRFRDSFVFTTEPITQREAPRPSHIFVVSAAGGTRRQLTSGTASIATGEAASTLSWSPDGHTIAFTLVPSAILNEQSYSHVELVDVATRQLRALTGHTAFEADPHFSPDGTHIAYVWSNGDGQVNQAKLYVTTPQGGEGTPVWRPTIGRSVMPRGCRIRRPSCSLAIVTPPSTSSRRRSAVHCKNWIWES